MRHHLYAGLVALVLFPATAQAQFGQVGQFFGIGSGSNTDNNTAPNSGSKPDMSKALGVHDLLCERDVVEPFELSTNLTDVFTASLDSTVNQIGQVLLGSVFGARPNVNSVTDASFQAAKQAARNMNWLPMSMELRLGQNLHEVMADQIAGSREAPTAHYQKAARLLNEILAQVQTPHPYNFQIHVTRESGKNAVALPGGLLYMTRDALDWPDSAAAPVAQPKGKAAQASKDKQRGGQQVPAKRTEAEDAARFTLAHEIAHVLKRHETRAVQNRVVDSIDSYNKLRFLFQGNDGPSPQLVLGAVGYLKNLHESYSPDQEKQADACAIRLLARHNNAGAAHQAFIAFMKQELEAKQDQGGGLLLDSAESGSSNLKSNAAPPLPPEINKIFGESRGSHPEFDERLSHGLAVMRGLQAQ